MKAAAEFDLSARYRMLARDRFAIRRCQALQNSCSEDNRSISSGAIPSDLWQFPDEDERIFEEAEAYRALPVEERLQRMMAVIELGLAMQDVNPRRDVIRELRLDGWPDYVVVLSTVTRRAMAWYVKLGLRNEPPRVMLPTFDGHFSDEVGTGTAWARQVLDHSIFQPAEKAVTVLTFDEDAFGKELAKRIWLELCRVAPKVRLDKVRALAIDCIPYHSMLHLSLLTDREEFAADDEYAKWETEVWRFHDFPSTPQAHWPGAEDLILHVQHWQQSRTETLTNEEVAATDDQVCRACAKALLDPQVADALKHFKFQLTDDFEFGVWDPDNQAEGNYCDIIREERAGGEANAR